MYGSTLHAAIKTAHLAFMQELSKVSTSLLTCSFRLLSVESSAELQVRMRCIANRSSSAGRPATRLANSSYVSGALMVKGSSWLAVCADATPASWLRLRLGCS